MARLYFVLKGCRIGANCASQLVSSGNYPVVRNFIQATILVKG